MTTPILSRRGALLAACALPGLSLVGCRTPPVKTASQPAQPMPRIGLALGGGAARGFAHIGVIKALEAQGIVPDLIAGTSAGSVVGAMYAAGFNGFELQRQAMQMDETTIADWTLPSRGVLRGEALQAFINKAVEGRAIEQLPRRLAITATELKTGDLAVFERGNTGQAVRASSSVPAVFQPVTINGLEYVDGGLASPVPAALARRMGADVVIAVDVSSRPSVQPLGGSIDLLLQTFAIMGQSIAAHELRDADVVIRPALGSTKGTDFAARHLSILEGETAASAQLGAIRQAIANARERLKGPQRALGKTG